MFLGLYYYYILSLSRRSAKCQLNNVQLENVERGKIFVQVCVHKLPMFVIIVYVVIFNLSLNCQNYQVLSFH